MVKICTECKYSKLSSNSVYECHRPDTKIVDKVTGEVKSFPRKCLEERSVRWPTYIKAYCGREGKYFKSKNSLLERFKTWWSSDRS